jgi:hypothetical protein
MANILEKSYKTYLSHAESQQVNLHTYDAMIDKEVFNLYEIYGADLEEILREQGTPAGYFPVIEGFELIPDDMLPEAKDYIKNLQKMKLAPEKLNEKMQDGSLPVIDLEFLYYETPVGKVRRNKQFGREHIDILAKERHKRKR